MQTKNEDREMRKSAVRIGRLEEPSWDGEAEELAVAAQGEDHPLPASQVLMSADLTASRCDANGTFIP